MRLLVPMLFVAACSGSPAGLCDNAQLSFTCSYSTGQCVEFTGLSTEDQFKSETSCRSAKGTALTGSCAIAGRLGTCTIPPTNSVVCSPGARVDIRFFSPYTQPDAMTACNGITGSTWAPN